MELGRVLLLGTLVGSTLAACSSRSNFFFADGGPEGGSSSVTGGSDARADAKKKTDGASSDSGEEEEEIEDSGTVKTDSSTKTDTGGSSCTLAMSLLILAVLIGDMVKRSWSVWTDRGTDFLTSGLSITDASEAGVWPGIKGTIVLMVLVVALAFPLGIACAVYLEEYAGKSTFARWTRVNVRNLAGVPSVVYGLLGLGIFVKVLDSFNDDDGVVHHEADGQHETKQRKRVDGKTEQGKEDKGPDQ